MPLQISRYLELSSQVQEASKMGRMEERFPQFLSSYVEKRRSGDLRGLFVQTEWCLNPCHPVTLFVERRFAFIQVRHYRKNRSNHDKFTVRIWIPLSIGSECSHGGCCWKLGWNTLEKVLLTPLSLSCTPIHDLFISLHDSTPELKTGDPLTARCSVEAWLCVLCAGHSYVLGAV